MRELGDITGAIVDAALRTHRFGAPTLREGLRRIVNGFPSSAPSRLRVNQVAVDRPFRQRY